MEDIGSPSTFYPFNRLPTEPRLTIWEYSFTPGFICCVLEERHIREEQRDVVRHFKLPLPATLYVNHEARFIALKHYQRFETSPKLFCRRKYGRTPFWLNAEIDFFYPLITHSLRLTRCRSMEPEEIVNSAQHLVVPSTFGQGHTQPRRSDSIDNELKYLKTLFGLLSAGARPIRHWWPTYPSIKSINILL